MSSLSCGIVGLPNAGKSTLFNALASRRLAETAPRPFTTIDPHEAVVLLPDEYLVKLSGLVKPDETVPATVTFIDIAGLVKDAHKGEGLGNQFLAKIREVDAIVHVVGAYETSDTKKIKDDIEIINLELELGEIKDKPTIYVINYKNEKPELDIKEAIYLDAKQEEDLIDFSEEEKKDLGVSDSALEKLIKKAYNLLDLITFYTIKGGKEVHAWSLKKGSTAFEAAERVHTDFAEKFIKAEAINVNELLKSGDWKQAKEKGLIRLEGRDYQVQDKDVIEFKVGS